MFDEIEGAGNPWFGAGGKGILQTLLVGIGSRADLIGIQSAHGWSWVSRGAGIRPLVDGVEGSAEGSPFMGCRRDLLSACRLMHSPIWMMAYTISSSTKPF